MASQIDLSISGMTCGGCAARVEGALRGVSGVAEASVNLMTESARVVMAADTEAGVATSQLVSAVKAAGYEARARQPAADAVKLAAEERRWSETHRRNRQAMIQAIGLALPILAVEHFRHHLWTHGGSGQVAAHLLQFILLGMLAVSPAGGPVLAGGIRALVQRTGNMDLLITMGFAAAVASSLYGVFIARDESFVHIHAAAMILGLVCIGRYLEARARSGASMAIAALAKRAPREALVQRSGEWITAPIESIDRGARVRVVAPGVLPVDGRVVEGSAQVDERLLTGESMPVRRGQGDSVMGGTVVVEGTLTVEALATGAAATIGRMLALVESAQAGRTRMQRLADKVAGIFTPVVIIIAAATFVAWIASGAGASSGARAAIAVLVVACPCALGLATPVVITVAATQAALRGILVRDPEALEAMGRIDTVAWDKTGTLTMGRPRVEAVEPADAFDRRSLLTLAASAESHATHPLATAIVEAARREGLMLIEPKDVRVIAGRGVSAVVGGKQIEVGRGDASASGVLPSTTEQSHGATPVFIQVDGRMAGCIWLRDTVRPSSADAITRLKRLGIGSAMLTGDDRGVAETVARDVGVDQVWAREMPDGKVARVSALRGAGRRVAMIGDGINDAAALAAADVGVAFATGADVAAEAADINLVGSTPHLVADAVVLARSGVRLIRENLAWAFGYNIIAIPLAALGRLPPAWAAAMMMGSSLAVVLNALRLPRVLRNRGV